MPRTTLTQTLVLAGMVAVGGLARGQDALEEGWSNPPVQARLRAYWWWLNGNVTQEAITKDLKWMKAIGMGGALVFDAGGATEGGHGPVPAGPLFGSPPWRALFTHALREADRLGLEIGLNLQSGWNLGGPMVTLERAAKLITWSQLRLQGPTRRAGSRGRRAEHEPAGASVTHLSAGLVLPVTSLAESRMIDRTQETVSCGDQAVP